MRGSIIRRGPKRFALVFDAGHALDPKTGQLKRRQKWVTFRGTLKQAEAKLAGLVDAAGNGNFIEPSKLTLVAYLRDWHGKAVVPYRRPETARIYQSMIETHVAPSAIAHVPLQKLRTTDLEAFYAGVKLKASSCGVLHAVLHRALKTAVRDRLITANPASAVEHRPRASKDHSESARQHCWTASEAKTFIKAAEQHGPQAAAFYRLAIDCGARKSELLGLTWADLDLDAGGTVRIARQLDAVGPPPVWGVTKTGRARTVTLGAETISRLKAHKRSQAAVKLANGRQHYADHDLIFAQEAAHQTTPNAKLGEPVLALSESTFRRITKAAGVRPIKFHGLRHTSATLLLGASVPVHVVAQRLGHAQVSMTLEVYAHALPDQQQAAAIAANGLLT